MKLTGKKTQFLLKLRILKWVEKRGESSKKRKKKRRKEDERRENFRRRGCWYSPYVTVLSTFCSPYAIVWIGGTG